MLSEGRRDLLAHPVAETFLHLKWQRMRAWVYFGIVYRLVMAMMTTAMLVVGLRHLPVVKGKGKSELVEL